MHDIVDFAHVHTLSLIVWALLAATVVGIALGTWTYALERSNRRANRALARYLAQQVERHAAL